MVENKLNAKCEGTEGTGRFAKQKTKVVNEAIDKTRKDRVTSRYSGVNVIP